MTDLTDEAVKALLDGATPGPWAADETDPSDVVVWAHPDKAQNDELIANVGHRVHPVALAFDCDGPNARLMAAAPDLARALLESRAECEGAHMIIATERAEVVRLRAENARLRADAQATIARLEAALEFYAPKEVAGIKFAGGDDAGQRARAALAGEGGRMDALHPSIPGLGASSTSSDDP